MKIKTVTRNLNLNPQQRKPSSRYRVKFGDADAFDILRVRCVSGAEVQIYETSASRLPDRKGSIHFLAHAAEGSFIISWCGDAGEYMRRKYRIEQ